MQIAPDSNVSETFTPKLPSLTPEQKLRTASLLYWSARNLKAAALRQAHPEWTPQKVDETVREIFLTAPSLNR